MPKPTNYITYIIATILTRNSGNCGFNENQKMKRFNVAYFKKNFFYFLHHPIQFKGSIAVLR